MVTHATASSRPTARNGARSLTQQVVSVLSEQIRNGTYRPSEKLPTESRLMEQEGVSRTVVREAISCLQAMGLVETRHGIGTFVLAQPSDTPVQLDRNDILTMIDVMAVLELRIGLETEAAGLAASRRSDEQLHQIRQAMDTFIATDGGESEASINADLQFHLNIARATGNAYFHDILNQLGQMLIPRKRIDSAAFANHDPASYLRYVHGEHESIYGAIARRDPDAARAAMRIHLTNSRERLRSVQERISFAADAASRAS